MAFCSTCGTEIPDGASVCPSCGTPAGQVAPVETVDQWDHTSEFDPKDISDNKIYALSAYMFSIFGVILCQILAKESPYAQFHARQSLKLELTALLSTFVAVLLCWTCIVPIAWVIFVIMLSVIEIIAVVQVFMGKAKEPWLVRSIGLFR